MTSFETVSSFSKEYFWREKKNIFPYICIFLGVYILGVYMYMYIYRAVMIRERGWRNIQSLYA